MLQNERIQELIQFPSRVTVNETTDLKELVDLMPYISSFSILYLKALSKANDLRFPSELERLAPHINDRSILFQTVHQNDEIEVEKKIIPTITPEIQVNEITSTEEKIEAISEEVNRIAIVEIQEEKIELTEDIQESAELFVHEIEEKDSKQNLNSVELEQANEESEIFEETKEKSFLEETPESVDIPIVEIAADQEDNTIEKIDFQLDEIEPNEVAVEQKIDVEEIPTDLSISQEETLVTEVNNYIKETKIQETEAVVESIEIEEEEPIIPLSLEQKVSTEVKKNMLDNLIHSAVISGDYFASTRNKSTSPTTSDSILPEEKLTPETPSEVSSEESVEIKTSIPGKVSFAANKHRFTSWLKAAPSQTIKEDKTPRVIKTTSNDESNSIITETIESRNSISATDQHVLNEETELKGEVLTIEKPKREFFSPEKKAKESLDDANMPISETLAKIFSLQGKYQKAISIYEQLMLIIPEKKSFFASQIKNLKKKLNE